MVNHFKKQFEQFLKENYKDDIEINATGNTFFTTYHLIKQKIIFHLIDYQTFVQNKILPEFFQSISIQAHKNNLKVIHIWEDYWFVRNTLVKSRILNIIKSSIRVSARSCVIQKIDKQLTDDFFNFNHLQGATSYYYKYGLFKGSKLVAAIAFSKSRVMVDGPNLYRSYELVRFASLCGYSVVGGLGKLLNHFIKTQHAQHIMTYIDLDWGFGESYYKHGFVQTAIREPNYFFINKELNQRIYVTKQTQAFNPETDILGFNAGSAKLILDLRRL
ncbi:MAG: hypothetical protein Q8M15_06940 [Bacteroidota bacterium]|nr:hypothetical protein [Bacteroidota bacterium]